MKVAEFDFELPPDRIAQEPAGERDASRLLVLERGSGRTTHRIFREIGDELAAGDLLVLNDTKVVPARLSARKSTGGRIEILLVEPLERPSVWRALLSGGKSLRPGVRLTVSDALAVEILEREGESWRVELSAAGDPTVAAFAAGSVPLPPYIERSRDDPRAALDRERYQTVYASRPGAVAAPTAGLHFTPRLLEAIRARGVAIAEVVLHVGIGTFRPLRPEDLASGQLHAERFELPAATAQAVAAARARGGRVCAVGTTSARVLESCADADGRVSPQRGETRLFLAPGARFRAVDALLTNFHLPRSSLLLLVCAFAGREPVLAAYREALALGYRFYSYGDAMWIAGET